MKIYIAGRFKQATLLVHDIKQQLPELGHELTFDWMLEKSLKPYHENREDSAVMAQKMRQGCVDADIFILVWDDSLYGALIELGMALGASSGIKQKKIYIVGEKQRISIFEMMPEFTVCQDIPELIKLLRVA